MKNNRLVKCSNCKGEGQTFEGYEDYYPLYESCGYCDSTGKTTRSMNAWISIWEINPSFEPSEKSVRKSDRILNFNEKG